MENASITPNSYIIFIHEKPVKYRIINYLHMISISSKNVLRYKK